MLVRIIYLLEVLTIVACIHAFYGKKAKFNIHTMVLIVLLTLNCDLMNTLQIGELSSFINYFAIYLYCKIEYKESLVKTGISVILISISIVIIQFLCLLITVLLLPDKVVVRTLLINIETLCMAMWGLPRLSVDRLRRDIRWKNKFIILILLFAGTIIIIMMIQDKKQKGLNMEWFVFVIPALAVILGLIRRWSSAQSVIHLLEQERETTKNLGEKYQELLLHVRMRQHELKNHISALFATHYTYKTYERLVAAQKEYSNKLLDENKYTGLLLIGNNFLAAFLYEKFRQAEDDGIVLEYYIEANVTECAVPVYYLIEMLGIIFDNAVDAVKDMNSEKKIILKILGKGDEYQFIICNRSDYVPYVQIEQWFRLDSTSKGFGHGLGLYHIKELCEEWKCDISCQNVDIEGINWLQFMLIVKKAGDH